jgi:hypothetical protein
MSTTSVLEGFFASYNLLQTFAFKTLLCVSKIEKTESSSESRRS